MGSPLLGDGPEGFFPPQSMGSTTDSMLKINGKSVESKDLIDMIIDPIIENL